MAKTSAPKKENRIVRYLRETRAELAKVTWPTREEALRLTGIVLATTIGFALFLGVVDYLLSKLFALLVR
ncbi:MAG: preprotein translocase subunit SecE [Chloroflexi bacterium]|nr:preprotein translocase subunit SecE [Chloroflexota bacterium]